MNKHIRSRRHLWMAVAFCAVLVSDQASKFYIERTVPVRYHVNETFFYITHELNPGLVGGIFGQSPVIVRVAPIVATLVLLYLYRHLESSSAYQSAAFGMIAGGAAGNIIDRFFRGNVVDFLQFNFYFLPDFLHLPTTRYPAFNVADSAICVGVGVLIFCWHRLGRTSEAADVVNAD